MSKIYAFGETDSTNDEAKRMVRALRPSDDPSELYGAVVTASRQTAGRGRLGRSFVSPGGNSVYASFIVKPPADPPYTASLLSRP